MKSASETTACIAPHMGVYLTEFFLMPVVQQVTCTKWGPIFRLVLQKIVKTNLSSGMRQGNRQVHGV